MSIVAKRSPISAAAEHLLHSSRQSVVGHIGDTWRIQLNLCTLVPPGEYDSTRASLGPHKPKREIDRFSRFCTADGRKVPILYNGRSFPQKLPFPIGGFGPHLIRDSYRPARAHNSNNISIGSAVFAQVTAVSLYFAIGHSSRSKLPLPMGDLDPV